MSLPRAVLSLALPMVAAITADARADEPAEPRFSAGLSTGVTTIGDATGSSVDVAIGIATGPAAVLRLELGDTELDGIDRSDRRGSGSIVFDLTPPARWRSALALTPFVEAGLGVTRTLMFGSSTWRPHVQGGVGLRLALGARIELSARAQHGIQRAPEALVLQEAADRIAPPLMDGERERYTRWQIAGALRF